LDQQYLDSFLLFSRPFVEEARSIFLTMMETSLKTCKPFIKEDQFAKFEYTAAISLRGELKKTPDSIEDFDGLLVLSFPLQTYLKVASAMMMSEYTQMHADIEDVGLEVCNMITGNAKKSLKKQGIHIGMAIPEKILQIEQSLPYPDRSIVIAIPVECEHGEFLMELSYRPAVNLVSSDINAKGGQFEIDENIFEQEIDCEVDDELDIFDDLSNFDDLDDLGEDLDDEDL
jgi:chemotaxis protein CheX